MYYFYVLVSKKDNELYWGFSTDLRERIDDHNRGKVHSTKERRPLVLAYYEAYRSEEEARNRERQIKRRAKAFIALKRRIKKSTFLNNKFE